jgi:hypothetical protein
MKRALALVVALAGCALGSPPRPEEHPAAPLDRWGKPVSSQPPPVWVLQLPQSTGTRIYAVGRSGPTFWPQDALASAAEDARGKLALALASHVERIGQASEATGQRARAFDLSKEATDLDLSNARIEATWIDEAGLRDERGSAWALAVIDFGDVKGGSAPESAPGTVSAAPPWLEALPGSAGRIYASGYSGPTFRPEAALEYARAAAIENLAATLRSHVQAYQLLVETSSRLSVEEFSHADRPEKAFEDLVQKKARIDDVWVDAKGVRAGEPPGSVWALASIEVPTEKGTYRTIDNADLGPALDEHGDATSTPEPGQSSTPPKAKR